MALPPISRLPLIAHGSRMLVDPAWRERLSALGILDPRQPHAEIPGQQLSASPATQCFRIVLPTGETVYFKRYVYTQRRPPNYWLLPSKACNEVWGLQRLQQLEIPTVEVLALGEYRQFGSLICGFLVTRGLSDAENLHEVIQAQAVAGHTIPLTGELRQVAERLIDQVAYAHAQGFFHRDLCARNILLQRNGGAVDTVWIDCPRSSDMLLRNWRGRVVDLWNLVCDVRNQLSIYTQYRLLRRYAAGMDRATRSRLYHAIHARFVRRKLI